jgi:ribulose 1,5-bisphosphate synthetase/thiazole synthase
MLTILEKKVQLGNGVWGGENGVFTKTLASPTSSRTGARIF